MPYIDDNDVFSTPAQKNGSQMDELDLSKAKKVDTSKALRNGRYDGLKPVDELPPLKIDMMKPEKKVDTTYYAPQQSYAKHKHAVYRTEEEVKQRKRGIFVVILLIVCAYIFMLAYVKNLNADIIKETSAELSSIGVSSLKLTETNYDKAVSYFDKQSYGLSFYLADSDGDGLSDAYEIAGSSSDAMSADSDGDGLSDGVEMLAGLGMKNPMTDGTTPDAKVSFMREISVDGSVLSLSGNAEVYIAQMTEYPSAVQNYPGVIGSILEIHSVESADEAILSFKTDKNTLSKWNSKAENLSVFSVSPDGGALTEVSDVTSEGGMISVPIKKDGMYVLADKTLAGEKAKVNIFFLIDNSGSMYPEEECDNSEENDVDFKRLDLAEDIIGEFDKSVNFGVAKFTQKYTLISGLDNSHKETVSKIQSIKGKAESFTGTEIAQSIIRAADEFDNRTPSRNYIILITDGMSTVTNEKREQAAIEYCNEKNITVITIGLGKQIKPTYLVELSEKTHGMFFRVSNAEGLEDTCEKITLLIKDSQINVSDNDGDMYVISDTGYSYNEDGMRFNIPTTDSENGMALGTATVNKKYYSGTLPMAETDGYKAENGNAVSGYDVAEYEFFKDTRQDLALLELDCSSTYNRYLAINDKWTFNNVTDGLLQYNSKTKEFLSENGLTCVVRNYNGTPEEQDKLFKLFRIITFQNIDDFSRYELAVIDTSKLSYDDKSVIDMIYYYDNLYDTDRANIYSFGANGDTAFDTLSKEMSEGLPSVVTTGSDVYNVSRFLRDNSHPDKYIIEAYNINSGSKPVKITLERRRMYDGKSGTSAQYIAIIDGKEVPLYIYAG